MAYGAILLLTSDIVLFGYALPFTQTTPAPDFWNIKGNPVIFDDIGLIAGAIHYHHVQIPLGFKTLSVQATMLENLITEHKQIGRAHV